MKKKHAPAYQLIAHVWEHCPYHGDSWNRLNTAMQHALHLAIDAGLTFDKNDFDKMLKDFRGGRWFGADDGEWFYVEAVVASNTSAAQAYEHYRGRKPFIADGVTPARYGSVAQERKRERLAEGFRFNWKGKVVTVTSFAKDGSYLTACSYKTPPEGSYKHEVAKRYRITVADIQADRKERKAGKGK